MLAKETLDGALDCEWPSSFLHIFTIETRSPSSTSTTTPSILNADRSSVIAVPAIAADARKTWAGPAEDGIGWLDKLQSNLPSANIILYDHLEPEERRLELRDPKDPTSRTVAREYASAEASLAEYGVDDYADRLIRAVQQYRLFSGVRHPTFFFLI